MSLRRPVNVVATAAAAVGASSTTKKTNNSTKQQKQQQDNGTIIDESLLPSPELLAFTNQVNLTATQKNKIIDVYLVATPEERKVITRMYTQAFRDAHFVQLLLRRAHLLTAAAAEQRVENEISSSSSSSSSSAATKQQQQQDGESNSKKGTTATTSNGKKAKRRTREEAEEEDAENQNQQQQEENNSSSDSEENSSTSSNKNKNKNKNNNNRSKVDEVQAHCRTLRQQIEEVVTHVVGPGPHRIRFDVARTPSDCDKILKLYDAQFVYPDMSTLKTIVMPPKYVSTRRRTRRTGNFNFFIRYEKTNEMACVASVNIHAIEEHHDNRIIFEVPLFATAAGFKQLGLARLMNAAIQELATNMKAELVLISADTSAVPFWTGPTMGGYSTLTRMQKGMYEFIYDTKCHHFGDVTLLGWEPPSGAEAIGSASGCGSLQNALEKCPKFVLDGPARLPLP